MTLKFGTDGVRGVANIDLTPELVVALGRAAARVLGGGEAIVGRDTRRSGPALQAALSAGLAAEGVTVADVGVVPTPTVAHLSATRQVPGAVISASHNRFADNGVKLFAAGGHKLDDATEAALEAELDRLLSPDPSATVSDAVPTGTDVGTLISDADGVQEYRRHLLEDVVGNRRLHGLRVVVDCAHGAAATVAPSVLADLGVDLIVIGDRPDGTNINDGFGSTAPGRLQRLVVERSADAGVAFDGDADRLIAVDAHGDLVDGDHIIALCAADMHERGTLRHDTVVVTVMTNLGFRHAMQEQGVTVVETAVGDRSVLAALQAGSFSLGGEQSGHVIFSDVATTGDGLVTAISLLDVMARTGRPLAELAAVMNRLPQVLVNVKVEHRLLDIAERIAAEITEAETDLGEHGRVLVRPSGPNRWSGSWSRRRPRSRPPRSPTTWWPPSAGWPNVSTDPGRV